MTQLTRIDGSMIADSDTLTLVELVEQNKAYLSEANLSGENLSVANLSEAYLHNADLSRANLSGANIYMANLFRANLCEADLYKANLCWADLSGADLSVANLSGTDLSGVDLSGTVLYVTDLSGADLSMAYLSKAKGIVQFGPVPTSGRIGYCVDHGDKIMVKLGCWWGEFDETIQRIAEKHPGEKGDAYADMVKAAARSLEVAR